MTEIHRMLLRCVFHWHDDLNLHAYSSQDGLGIECCCEPFLVLFQTFNVAEQLFPEHQIQPDTLFKKLHDGGIIQEVSPHQRRLWIQLLEIGSRPASCISVLAVLRVKYGEGQSVLQ